MRAIREPLVRLGEIAIEDIEIDAVCRDDIPAVLRGIQHLYCNEELRQQVFDLLDAHFLPSVNRGLGRPGMDLWRIFVLATLKQGIGCDYDRLQDLANRHGTVREMLGHSGLDDHHRYEHRTLVRNVSLLTPELLNKINELVVKAGHALFGQEPEAPLRARADSFVVETDVHYPTDVNLMWDAMRCLIRVCAELASAFGLGGLAAEPASAPAGEAAIQQDPQFPAAEAASGPRARLPGALPVAGGAGGNGCGGNSRRPGQKHGTSIPCKDLWIMRFARSTRSTGGCCKAK